MNPLNKAAAVAEEKAKAPKPEASPVPDEGVACPMCGAMHEGTDPEKLKAFMENNPFKKK